jgi:hypothetical protein
MANNKAEVIIKTRSPVDRRRVKDRRSFLKNGDLDHKPERRVNIVGRRMLGDRRGLVSQYYEYFLKKRSLILKRKYFAY